MKKILFVCIGTNVGGIERSLINVLNSINLDEYNVDLLLWEAPGELYPLLRRDIKIIDRGKIDVVEKQYLKEYSLLDRVAIVKRYIHRKILSKTSGKIWLAARRLKEHYDVAIAYSHNDYSLEYVIDKVDATEKVLWFHHGVYDIVGKNDLFNKKYYPLFDKIIAVSDTCKKELEKVFPHLSEKIIVIYNKINEFEIKEKAKYDVNDISEEGYIIVTVARIAKEKGIDIAIQAAKKLHDAGYDFTWYFVGKGTMWDDVQKEIINLDLERKCVLLGAKDNPYPYINRANIYVQPSRVESFGLTVAEAKVLKKFIIASNLPEIEKQLWGYKECLIVKADADYFFEAIKNEIERAEYCSNVIR